MAIARGSLAEPLFEVGESGILRSGFLRQALSHPDNDAIVIDGRVYSYGEADEIARRWAAALVGATGGRPRRVGVFAYRSEASYLGVLAALYAGAAFVPLNRKFPIERTRTMLELADVDALIVDAASLAQLREVLNGVASPRAILLPETDWPSQAAPLPGVVFDRNVLARTVPLHHLPSVRPDDLAYLLFTSGSTGQPNGVPIINSNVRAFIDVNCDRYRLSAKDRVTQTFDQTFDLSVFDLFMAWDAGACVCAMQPADLLSPFAFLEKHQVTLWFSVPSAASFLIKRGLLTPGSMPTLRWSLFCGEGLPQSTAEAWGNAAPASTIENLYGPTELTIACSVYRWDRSISHTHCVNDLVPIGEVFPGLERIIVDEELDEVESGAVGELCVAGAQTSPGYWNNPVRTSERFFERTGSDGSKLWFHRTGDLVSERDGRLAYLGRRDTQIKISGYRIELGEIEGVLRRAGCVEAVALPWPDEREPEHIVAVVSGATDLAEIDQLARRFLPHYMVPSAVHQIAEMPLNANAKIDRKELRKWLGSRPTAQAAGTPASELVDPFELVATALGCARTALDASSGLGSPAEWDSFGHINVMLALASAYAVKIDDGNVRKYETMREIIKMHATLAGTNEGRC